MTLEAYLQKLFAKNSGKKARPLLIAVWAVSTLIAALFVYHTIRLVWIFTFGRSEAFQQVLLATTALGMILLPTFIIVVYDRGRSLASLKKPLLTYFIVLIAGMFILTPINYSVQQTYRINKIKHTLLPHPSATHYRVEYFPGDNFDNEPSVKVHFLTSDPKPTLSEVGRFYQLLPREVQNLGSHIYFPSGMDTVADQYTVTINY